MHARALICDQHQRFHAADVELPDPGPAHVVARTLYSGVSIGTEFALIRNKLNWGPYPLCTGYQAIGVVEYAGDRVDGFSTGDRIYYRDNKRIKLQDGNAVSAVAGTHCSMAVIDPGDTHGLALLPDGVPEDAGSLFVMPAVGLNGVDMSNPRMGDVVVVYGAGLIGLGVIGACSHRGCIVVAVDIEDNRLEVARELGADLVINSTRQNVKAALAELAPDGADVVFESTGIPGCLDPAIELCRTEGKFIHQGNYGAAPITYNFLTPHGKRLTTFYPCDDGLAPCRRAVLKNMATGVLPWAKTITHRVDAEQAPDLYDRINKGKAPDVIGAVIKWS